MHGYTGYSRRWPELQLSSSNQRDQDLARRGSPAEAGSRQALCGRKALHDDDFGEPGGKSIGVDNAIAGG
jgi:hypothetical protein